MSMQTALPQALPSSSWRQLNHDLTKKHPPRLFFRQTGKKAEFALA
jgi:hypothetical protein